MRKTSVYLDERELRRLAHVAREEHTSQAAIIRRALDRYLTDRTPRREFALDGAGAGPGGSIADIPEEELLEGFGE